MAQLSLTEVSKRFNVNRTTIYRAVSSGKLSRLSNGFFDLAEVIRVFGEPPAPETPKQRPEATTCNDTETPIDQAMQHDEANSSVTKQHDATAQNNTSLMGRFGRGLKAFLK